MWSNNEWMFYLQVLMWMLVVFSAALGILGLGYFWGTLRAFLVKYKGLKRG